MMVNGSVFWYGSQVYQSNQKITTTTSSGQRGGEYDIDIAGAVGDDALPVTTSSAANASLIFFSPGTFVNGELVNKMILFMQFPTLDIDISEILSQIRANDASDVADALEAYLPTTIGTITYAELNNAMLKLDWSKFTTGIFEGLIGPLTDPSAILASLNEADGKTYSDYLSQGTNLLELAAASAASGVLNGAVGMTELANKISTLFQNLIDYYDSIIASRKPKLRYLEYSVYEEQGLSAKSVTIATVLANTGQVLQSVEGSIYQPNKAPEAGFSLPNIPSIPTMGVGSYNHPFKVEAVTGGIRIEEGRVLGYNMLEWWNLDDYEQNFINKQEGAVKWDPTVSLGVLPTPNFYFPEITTQDASRLLNANSQFVVIPDPTKKYVVYLKFKREIEPRTDGDGTSGNNAIYGDTTLAWYIGDADAARDKTGTGVNQPHDRVGYPELRLISEFGEKGNYPTNGEAGPRIKRHAPMQHPSGAGIDSGWNPDETPATYADSNGVADVNTRNQRWTATIGVIEEVAYYTMAFYSDTPASLMGRRTGSYSMGGWSSNRPGTYIQRDFNGYPYSNEYTGATLNYIDWIDWGTKWVYELVAFFDAKQGIQILTEEVSRYSYSFWDGGEQYYQIARVGPVTINDAEGLPISITAVNQMIRSDFFFTPPPDVYWTYDEHRILDFFGVKDDTITDIL
jgi:hypothetical protein